MPLYGQMRLSLFPSGDRVTYALVWRSTSPGRHRDTLLARGQVEAVSEDGPLDRLAVLQAVVDDMARRGL